MTAISKNAYFNVVNDIVDEYNNTYHKTIKMKPIDPKFKVRDHARISEYKNIFAKGYSPNWSKETFVIKQIKNTVPWTYVISNLNGEEIVGSF